MQWYNSDTWWQGFTAASTLWFAVAWMRFALKNSKPTLVVLADEYGKRYYVRSEGAQGVRLEDGEGYGIQQKTWDNLESEFPSSLEEIRKVRARWSEQNNV